MPHRPPLLFLHGAFAGPEIWERFIAPWFARRGHRVSVPHLPGPAPARSSRHPHAARLRDHVRAARAAAAEFGERPVAIGHSLGGLIAQHLAAEGRLAGAVLVASPGPLGLGPSLWRLAAGDPQVLAALTLIQAGAGARLGIGAARGILFTPDTPADWIAEVSPVLRSESARTLFDAATWDLPFWPTARLTPTLALLGDRDPLVPVSDLWALGATYFAETELLAGRAHGLPIDPAWRSLAWRINAWLEERRIGDARRARPEPNLRRVLPAGG